MGRAIEPDEILAAASFADRIALGTAVAPARDVSRVKDAISTGAVYPLCHIGTRGAVAVLYVSRDARLAVVVSLHLGEGARDEPLRFSFEGLDPMLRYTARLTCGGSLPAGIPASAPGSYYMARRFCMPLTGDVRGVAMLLDAGPGRQAA